MAETIIKIRDLSKLYRLGQTGSGRFREDLRNWWFRKKGEYRSSAEIWALKDINLDINEGDAIGIIGNNGSGKSTLMKILSRIVMPTTGTVQGRGRIASLLEVGTGFQGDLTGRENIFLNGSILGMSNREIRKRFDEIVEFSGVSDFIDTPVKKYSSGMYMRLAFSVAAHLEPDIFILDEVLAVGDIEFQRKCITKMKQVSVEEGRTVFFVSHHLSAIQQLCNRVVCLHKGKLVGEGDPDSIIAGYLRHQRTDYLHQEYDHPGAAPGNGNVRIKKAAVIPQTSDIDNIIDVRTPLLIEFDYWIMKSNHSGITASIQLFDLAGICIFETRGSSAGSFEGLFRASCLIPANFLNDRFYYISLGFTTDHANVYDFEACLSFSVTDYSEGAQAGESRTGLIRPSFPVNISQISPTITSN